MGTKTKPKAKKDDVVCPADYGIRINAIAIVGNMTHDKTPTVAEMLREADQVLTFLKGGSAPTLENVTPLKVPVQ